MTCEHEGLQQKQHYKQPARCIALLTELEEPVVRFICDVALEAIVPYKDVSLLCESVESIHCGRRCTSSVRAEKGTYNSKDSNAWVNHTNGRCRPRALSHRCR